jgi:hypothetical protein
MLELVAARDWLTSYIDLDAATGRGKVSDGQRAATVLSVACSRM